MADYPVRIQNVIRNGYDFKMGDYISKGFSLMQKNIGGFIGFFLILFVGSFIVGLIPFIGSLATWVLTPPLAIGPIYVAYRLDRGEEPSFNDFFKGFDKFGDLFVTSLLTGLIIFACMIPFLIIFGIAMFGSAVQYGSGFEDFALASMGGAFFITLLLTLAAAVYIGISFMWAPMLVWFYDMRPWDAMMASRKISAKNFWIILVFLLVLGLISMLGVLLLFIGLLFAYPAVVCAQYSAFSDITELHTPEEGEEADDVIDHFAPTE